MALARAALERCGIEPREVATGGGSDANALVARGFDCVLLANGTEANHTPSESVAAARITEMLAVCEAIAELAGVAGASATMLKLRRGTVVAVDPLTVEVGGEQRRGLGRRGPGRPRSRSATRSSSTPQALDLGLGSGGFDVVHVNLTRGLRARGDDGVHVIKLNYTSLQHPVDPVEIEHGEPELGPEAAGRW